MVPAAGASLWGVVFARGYSLGAAAAAGRRGEGGGLGAMVRGMVVVQGDGLCYGTECYASMFWAMALSVFVAGGLWLWAWKGPGGWSRRGIAV